MFEQCLFRAGSLPTEGYHRNICGLVSVSVGSDVEREASEERTPRSGGRGATLSEEEEKVDHTGHKETPTTRASPFIVHNTSLFTLHSKSVHDVYSNQLIATEALDKGLQNKKKRRFLQGWFPTPSTRFRKGKESGRRKGTSIREKGSIATT